MKIISNLLSVLAQSFLLCCVFVCRDSNSNSISREAAATGIMSQGQEQSQDNFLSGYKIIEGDILVEDSVNVNSDYLLGDQIQDSGIIFQISRWSNAQIPYVISGDFGDWERSIIFGAMNEIMSSTCVQFTPRTWEPHYVFIQKHYGRVCNSVVGRSAQRSPQIMTLGEGCVNHWTVLHELVHVIGFYHEQNRADRDNFVSIIWNNIAQTNQHDFQKQGQSYDFGVGYDYKSIMHYASTYFGYAGRQTIVSKPPGINFGNARHLSFKDKLKIKRMYQCESTSVGTDRQFSAVSQHS